MKTLNKKQPNTLRLNLSLIATLVTLVASALAFNACTKKTDDATKSAATAETAKAGTAAKVEADPTDLMIEDLAVGTGTVATTGKMVSVHYTGWLKDGTKFDSSVDRDQPFSFPLGGGQVIQGWDKGVEGMKVGGRRKLTIPYQMAYGEGGRPPVIPPKATLIFEVQLLEVKE